MSRLPLVRDSVPLGRELRNAGGACAGANRAGLQTAVLHTPGAESRVSPIAALSRAHRHGGEASAVLPTLRLAGRRTSHRSVENARTGGARPASASSRWPFLFRSAGQNVSRAGNSP